LRAENITLPEKFYTGYNLLNGDGPSDLRMANSSFAPDSQSVLTLKENGELARWTGIDFQKKELLLTNISKDYDRGGFDGNGRFFMAVSTNNVISIWDISKQTLLRQFTNPAPAAPARYVSGYEKGLRDSIGFLDNGKKMVTMSPGRFHEWDLATGSEIQSWPASITLEGAGTTVFSPDEQWCVTIDSDGNVTARNLAEKRTSRLPLHLEETTGAAFSPDGKFFAVARGNFRCVQVWDIKTWRQVATLRGFANYVNSVAFSPDGKCLAVGGGAGSETVKLWDTDNWQEIGTLPGFGDAYQGPYFSPDGNCISVLSDGDYTLQIWRAPSWAEIRAAETKDKTEAQPP